MAQNSPFYPVGGLRGWLFRQVFGNVLQAQYAQATFMLNKNTPVYVDMENLLGVYSACPHLRLVIDRKAEMFSNADIHVVDKNGERVENHPLTELLRKPNALQTQEQYMAQWLIYYEVYAQSFEYKVKPPSYAFNSAPRVLWNLPPSNMEIIPTGKIWDQTTKEGIIAKYVMTTAEDGTYRKEFATGDIIHTTQGVSNKYITGQSKLISLEKPISNIMGALRTRNCIIFDRGALGILSSQSKDGSGGIPLGTLEKKELENQMRRDYGIQDGQHRTLITTAALTYQSMTFPTKDLMLFEEVEDDFSAICGTFGMARDIFPSVKGATFENQRQAVQQTYQNTIQPIADLYCRVRENDPDIKKLMQPGQRLMASYDWLPVMKEDELKEYQAEQSEQLAYQTQMQTIINLNAAVLRGEMKRESAIQALMLTEEYDQATASKLIS